MGVPRPANAGLAPDRAARVLGPDEWPYQRWGWLESVRRDPVLNPMAKLVAHSLALDFANAQSLRCDPRLVDLAEVFGCSTDTVKRAVADLVAAGWIERISGVGRGRSSGYGFLTRAKIVPLKGGKSAPLKGGKSAPLKGSEKGANLPLKGGKSAPAHNIDKPWKNHEGARGAASQKKISVNPVVIAEAERRVAAFRDGRLSAFEDAQPWVMAHVLGADLLTADELARAGLAEKQARGSSDGH